MFSGIVETTGKVIDIIAGDKNHRICFATNETFCKDLSMGCSVSVAGICLTVIDFQDNSFSCDISSATMQCTTLSQVSVGDYVNFERTVRLDQGIDGHLVSGHIDGVGIIKNLNSRGESTTLIVEAPAQIMKYIAVKGSVCIDGVSLTVNDIGGHCFTVNLIPHTYKVTTFKNRKVADKVNIEVDIIARYVARYLDEMKSDA